MFEKLHREKKIHDNLTVLTEPVALFTSMLVCSNDMCCIDIIHIALQGIVQAMS